MKILLFILTIATVLAFTSKQETATITVSKEKGKTVICWNFTADAPIDCAVLEIKNDATGGQFRTTFCGDGGNCLASNVLSANGCCTYAVNPPKGSVFRLRVIRDNWTSFYSNEAQ